MLVKNGYCPQVRYTSIYNLRVLSSSLIKPPIMTNLLNEHNEHEQWMGGSFGAVAHEGNIFYKPKKSI